jgi:hypothetical protein
MADLNKPYNPGIAELGKFVEVNAPSETSYGKYAILTYPAGGDMSAGPLGTSGNPMFTNTNINHVISSLEVSVSGFEIMAEHIDEFLGMTSSDIIHHPITSAKYLPVSGIIQQIVEPITIDTITSAVSVTGNVDVGTIQQIVEPITIDTITSAVSVTGNVDVGTIQQIVEPITIDTITSAVSVTGNVDVGTIDSITNIVSVVDVAPQITGISLWIGSTTLSADQLYVPTITGTPLDEIEIQNKTLGDIYFLPISTDVMTVSNNGIIISPDGFYSASRKINDITIYSVSGGNVRIIGYINKNEEN